MASYRYVKRSDDGAGQIRKWSQHDLDAMDQALRNWGDLVDDRYVLFFMDLLIEVSGKGEEIIHVDPTIITLITSIDTGRTDRGLDDVRDALATVAPEYTGPVKLVLIPLVHRGHWSLLVYLRTTGRWYHYDSYPTSSHRAFAKSLLGTFIKKDCLRPPLGIQADQFERSLCQQLDISPVISQQEDGWECGNFVLMYIQYLVNGNFVPLSPEIHGKMCTNRVMETSFRTMLEKFVKIARSFLQ